ncbi:hypothetical protein D3C80_1550320 [compost metagenome]
MVLGFIQVSLDAVVPGIVFQECPALMQVVPVDLARVWLGDLGCLAGEAQRPGLRDPGLGVLVCTWFVVERPDQLRRLALAGRDECLQRFFGVGVRGQRSHGSNAVM